MVRLSQSRMSNHGVLGISVAGAIIFGCASLDPNLPQWFRAGLSLGAIATNLSGLVCLKKLMEDEPRRVAREEVDRELAIQTELKRLNFGMQPQRPGPTAITQIGNVISETTGINWVEILAAPHLAVIGKTGSGKSALTQWLSDQMGGDITIYDSDASPSEWQGLNVIGRMANYEAIAAAMKADLEELQRRTELRAMGENNFPPMVRILEESPETLSALKDNGHDIGYQWLKGILRRGRKYGVKLILLSQGFSVRSLRIDGEGELRDNIAVLRLGKSAIQYAKDDIKQALKLQPRPILVEDDLVGCVPDLSGFLIRQNVGDRPINLSKSPAPPMHHAPDMHHTRTSLEALYHRDCTNAPLDEQIMVHCPKCGSEKIRTMGKRNDKTRYRCNDCGKAWS